MRLFWKKKYSSDEVLKIVAASSKQQVLEREEEYRNKTKLLEEVMSVQPDRDFLNFARAYDSRRKVTRRKKAFQTIAVVLVCVIAASGIALETSEAFKTKVYSLLFDDEAGGVTLRLEEESEALQDWDGHWYPAFMPEEFYLEASGFDDICWVLFFKSEDGSAEVRIIEMPLDMVVSVDTDTTKMEEITIGYHKGYLFEDKENANITLLLPMDEQQVEVKAKGQIDKKTVVKIAESLEYVKK